jgi:hypothetical protein
MGVSMVDPVISHSLTVEQTPSSPLDETVLGSQIPECFPGCILNHRLEKVNRNFLRGHLCRTGFVKTPSNRFVKLRRRITRRCALKAFVTEKSLLRHKVGISCAYGAQTASCVFPLFTIFPGKRRRRLSLHG